MTNMETKFTHEISKGIQSLKDEMSMEFAKVDNKIRTLENKMLKYESDLHVKNTTQSAINENSSQHKLVFKNITHDTSDMESPKAYVNGVLNAIGLDFNVVDVQKIGGKNNGTTNNSNQSKTVLVTFSDGKERIDVLRNKRKLKDTEDYKTLYIETDRSRHERMQEANLRRIIKSIPNLEFRGGRVVEKSD